MLKRLAKDSFALMEIGGKKFVCTRHVMLASKFFFQGTSLTWIQSKIRANVHRYLRQRRRKPIPFSLSFYLVRRYAKFVTRQTFRKLGTIALVTILDYVLERLLETIRFLSIDLRLSRITNRVIMLAIRSNATLNKLFPGVIPNSGTVEDTTVSDLEQRREAFALASYKAFHPNVDTKPLPLI